MDTMVGSAVAIINWYGNHASLDDTDDVIQP